jgi:glycogen debranching enzyme
VSPAYTVPILHSDSAVLERAFRAAVGDLLGNVRPWPDAEHPQTTAERSSTSAQRSDRGDASSRPCLLAGLHYDRPWTRDASINAWNGLSMMWPDVARNTLESVLQESDDGVRIGGQYWDAIIWATGAWHHYLVTGDRDFLSRAYEAACTTIRYFEATELDETDGLFRGGACFMDGIAGYPDRYRNPDWASGIPGWADRHPQMRHPSGEGFPAKALSTNLLYWNAYRVLPQMAHALDREADVDWDERARRLAAAIEHGFRGHERSTLRYLVDPWGGCDRQEGLGWAFAIVLGFIDDEHMPMLVSNAHTTAHGIPSLWPDYERYQALGRGRYGRHGATVWPHVNAFWADACVRAGRRDEGFRELELLAHKADRDGHFAEIYHPDTGERYGGEQEAPSIRDFRTWVSEPRQSWCASGFVRMVLSVFFGLRVGSDGLSLDPWLPPGHERLSIEGVRFRGEPLDIAVQRRGGDVVALLNGRTERRTP